MAQRSFSRRRFLKTLGLAAAAVSSGALAACDDDDDETTGTETGGNDDDATGGNDDDATGSDDDDDDDDDDDVTGGDDDDDDNDTGGVTRPEVDYEAIVIGSGFGGGVSALRLAQAGVKVAIIERGKRWVVDPDNLKVDAPFARNLAPDGRSMWLNTQAIQPVGPRLPIERYTGVLERVEADGIAIYAGAAWGGGSVVYGNLHLQPPRELFTRVFGPVVNYDEMDAMYYPRVVEAIGASRVPDEVYNAAEFEYARSMVRTGEAAGLPMLKNLSATNWDVLRKEISGELGFRDNILGQLIYGNNSGSKLSIDKSYLKLAEETGKVDAFVLHMVTEVTRDDEGRYVVRMDEINTSGEVKRKKTLTCRYLFMAAGTNGTNTLLLKAREEGLLPNLPPELGLEFGNNGNTMVMRSGLPFETGALQAGPPVVYLGWPDGDEGPVYMEAAQWPIGAECNCALHLGLSVVKPSGRYAYDKATRQVRAKFPPDGNAAARKAVLHAVERFVGAGGGKLEEGTGGDFDGGYQGAARQFHVSSTRGVCDWQGDGWVRADEELRGSVCD